MLLKYNWASLIYFLCVTLLWFKQVDVNHDPSLDHSYYFLQEPGLLLMLHLERKQGLNRSFHQLFLGVYYWIGL